MFDRFKILEKKFDTKKLNSRKLWDTIPKKLFILYNTINLRYFIKKKEKKEKTSEAELEEVELKIKKYQKELNRIKEMFPEKFFE